MKSLKSTLMFAAAACAATVSAGQAQAQVYIAKLDTPNQQYQLAWESPPMCDDETHNAITLWSNAGSKFNAPRWIYDYWYGKQVKGSFRIQTTFQPGTDMYTAGRVAETRYGNSVGSFTIGGKVIPVVDDADIVVNNDYWANNTLECGDTAPAYNQFDGGRIIAHEAGHVIGQDHLTSTACALYTYAQYAVAMGPLCTTEKNGIVALYGAK